MKVVHEPENGTADRRAVVTVGTFDGVHRAHREILRVVRERATALGGRSVVVTFDPHPREVVANGRGPVQLLTTAGERLDALQDAGVDLVLLLQFTYEFSRLGAREFYQRHVVDPLGAAEVVVGYDHMFGRDRKAGIGELEAMGRELGFAVHAVPPFRVNGEVVSSTLVRRALEAGDVERASAFLGGPYAVRGRVVAGDGRGRTIGWPTANLAVDSPKKLLPGNGVYLVRAGTPGGVRHGMANVGVRPTFGEGMARSVEAHLFGETADLYGAGLRLEFLRRLRDERRFASVAELVLQLERDREEALGMLKEGEGGIVK
jgi:riboflavin kinase/FMN adenylyltransferase